MAVYTPAVGSYDIFIFFVTFAGSIYVVEKRAFCPSAPPWQGGCKHTPQSDTDPHGTGDTGSGHSYFFQLFSGISHQIKECTQTAAFRLYSQRLTVNCMIMAIQIIWLVENCLGGSLYNSSL